MQRRHIRVRGLLHLRNLSDRLIVQLLGVRLIRLPIDRLAYEHL
jgi:hypothetical protein